MQKKPYQISVIMTVYNAGGYLKESVESILAQTYRCFELLLVDDGSTDGSGEACDDYARHDDRVKVIHRANGGCTAASLTGLEHAEGEYCMFIDSDDYVDKEMLEQMGKRLAGRKGEIVCCNHVIERPGQPEPVICPAQPGVYEGDRLLREIKEQLLGNERRILPISRCMKLYERSVFADNERYCDPAIHMGEDFNLVYPALWDCTRLVIMEDALFYHYRYVEQSMVHSYNRDIMDSVDRVWQLWNRVLDGKQITMDRSALDREYCYMLLLVMKNELRNPDKDYLARTREIFTREDVRRKIMNTPVSVKEKSNALLYLGMCYPDKTLLRLLRCVIRRYDRAAGRRRTKSGAGKG